MDILRPATLSDIPFLWYLRNRPYVREVSRNSAPISWEEHVEWALPVVLGLTEKRLFVVETSGIPAGQLRFDMLGGGKAEVSAAILQEFQGRGLAKKALKEGMRKMKRQKVSEILATIHRDNTASQGLFEKLGFQKNARQKGPWLEYAVLMR